MRPRARLTEGSGGFGTSARASSSSGSPSVKVTTAGYLRVVLSACCCTIACKSANDRYARSPGFTVRFGVRISVTAEVSAVAFTSSSATTRGSAGSATSPGRGANSASLISSFMPSFNPSLRPPSRYATPSATYFTLNTVRKFGFVALSATSCCSRSEGGVSAGVGSEVAGTAFAASTCASAGVSLLSTAGPAEGVGGVGPGGTAAVELPFACRRLERDESGGRETGADDSAFSVPAFFAITGACAISEDDAMGAVATRGSAAGVCGSAARVVANGVFELPLAAVEDSNPPTFALTGAGTVPVPGAPMPGNTVPSCKLPRLGCAAVGGVDALAVIVPLLPEPSCGKASGGLEAGTTDISASSLVGGGGAVSERRRNTPIKPPDAAAAGAPRRSALSAGALIFRTTCLPFCERLC